MVLPAIEGKADSGSQSDAATAREQRDEEARPLPMMPFPEQVVADYQTIRGERAAKGRSETVLRMYPYTLRIKSNVRMDGKRDKMPITLYDTSGGEEGFPALVMERLELREVLTNSGNLQRTTTGPTNA